MDQLFSIGEVARLLEIPTATLRFWEEEGLFSIHKDENHYRSYTGRDLVEIADVMFLRSLGIPVAKVNTMMSCSLENYSEQILSLQEQLARKVARYQKMQQHAQMQLDNLREAQRLKESGFSFEPVPFSCVEPFDYREKEKLMRYIENPSCYVRYCNTWNFRTETRGIIALSDDTARPMLWRKKSPAKFLTFLIREKVFEDYRSDVRDTLAQIQKKYRTGVLLSQYLLTAGEDGKRTDYLKGYVEIIG